MPQTIVDLGTLGGSSSGAYGINASGEVVGYSRTMGDAAQHAFLYSGGHMSDLGALGEGSFSSSATGINASGQVVGYTVTTDTALHAFLYAGGRMIDLGTLGGSKGAGTVAPPAKPFASTPAVRSWATQLQRALHCQPMRFCTRVAA